MNLPKKILFIGVFFLVEFALAGKFSSYAYGLSCTITEYPPNPLYPSESTKLKNNPDGGTPPYTFEWGNFPYSCTYDCPKPPDYYICQTSITYGTCYEGMHPTAQEITFSPSYNSSLLFGDSDTVYSQVTDSLGQKACCSYTVTTYQDPGPCTSNSFSPSWVAPGRPATVTVNFNNGGGTFLTPYQCLFGDTWGGAWGSSVPVTPQTVSVPGSPCSLYFSQTPVAADMEYSNWYLANSIIDSQTKKVRCKYGSSVTPAQLLQQGIRFNFDPFFQSVVPGGEAEYTGTLRPGSYGWTGNNFDLSVETCEGVGVTCTVIPSANRSTTSPNNTTKLTVQTSPSTPPGGYGIRIVATERGGSGYYKKASAFLTVTAPTATPTPTITPTPTPTPSPTPIPTSTPTLTPTPTPTVTCNISANPPGPLDPLGTSTLTNNPSGGGPNYTYDWGSPLCPNFANPSCGTVNPTNQKSTTYTAPNAYEASCIIRSKATDVATGSWGCCQITMQTNPAPTATPTPTPSATPVPTATPTPLPPSCSSGVFSPGTVAPGRNTTASLTFSGGVPNYSCLFGGSNWSVGNSTPAVPITVSGVAGSPCSQAFTSTPLVSDVSSTSITLNGNSVTDSRSLSGSCPNITLQQQGIDVSMSSAPSSINPGGTVLCSISLTAGANGWNGNNFNLTVESGCPDGGSTCTIDKSPVGLGVNVATLTVVTTPSTSIWPKTVKVRATENGLVYYRIGSCNFWVVAGATATPTPTPTPTTVPAPSCNSASFSPATVAPGRSSTVSLTFSNGVPNFTCAFGESNWSVGNSNPAVPISSSGWPNSPCSQAFTSTPLVPDVSATSITLNGNRVTDSRGQFGNCANPTLQQQGIDVTFAPSPQTVVAGGTANYTGSLAAGANGWNGNRFDLSVWNCPAITGLACVLNRNNNKQVPSNDTELAVSTTTSTPVGNYTVTILATERGSTGYYRFGSAVISVNPLPTATPTATLTPTATPSPTPICVNAVDPINLTTTEIATNSARANWSRNGLPASTAQVQWDLSAGSFSPPKGDTSDISGITTVLTSLTPETSYKWRVRQYTQICLGTGFPNWSNWVVSLPFTTESVLSCTQIPASLSVPSGGASSITVSCQNGKPPYGYYWTTPSSGMYALSAADCASCSFYNPASPDTHASLYWCAKNAFCANLPSGISTSVLTSVEDSSIPPQMVDSTPPTSVVTATSTRCIGAPDNLCVDCSTPQNQAKYPSCTGGIGEGADNCDGRVGEVCGSTAQSHISTSISGLTISCPYGRKPGDVCTVSATADVYSGYPVYYRFGSQMGTVTLADEEGGSQYNSDYLLPATFGGQGYTTFSLNSAGVIDRVEVLLKNDEKQYSGYGAWITGIITGDEAGNPPSILGEGGGWSEPEYACDFQECTYTWVPIYFGSSNLSLSAGTYRLYLEQNWGMSQVNEVYWSRHDTDPTKKAFRVWVRTAGSQKGTFSTTSEITGNPLSGNPLIQICPNLSNGGYSNSCPGPTYPTVSFTIPADARFGQEIAIYAEVWNTNSGCAVGETCGHRSTSMKGSVLAQEAGADPWWQAVNGGDIYGADGINSLIAPPPANASPYLISGEKGVARVKGDGTIFINGYTVSSTEDWQVKNDSLSAKSYLDFYQKLKDKITETLNAGDSALRNILPHLNGSSDPTIALVTTDLVIDTAGGYNHGVAIVLVEGNLTIEKDVTVSDNPQPSALMFIVKGNITIDPSVNRLDGVYFAEKDFHTGTTGAGNDRRLVGNGMWFVSPNGTFYLDRNLGGLNNAVTPAEVVHFEPKYLLLLMNLLGEPKYSWQEIPG